MARPTWLAIALVACAFEAARAADILDLGDTNVVTAETRRAVYSVSPSESTALGGARVHIIGEGFATDIFDGSNAVAIGSDAKGWVACDVIEGACTVDCGGPRKIVCDTGAWVRSCRGLLRRASDVGANVNMSPRRQSFVRHPLH